MTHTLRDALIDALRAVCANPEVAADVCLVIIEGWSGDEPSNPQSGYRTVAVLTTKEEAEQEARYILRKGKIGNSTVRNCYLRRNGELWEVTAYLL